MSEAGVWKLVASRLSGILVSEFVVFHVEHSPESSTRADGYR